MGYPTHWKDMETQHFFRQLAFLSLACALALWGLAQWPAWRAVTGGLAGSIALFALFSLWLFFRARALARLPNPNQFTRLVMSLSFIKMIAAVLAVVAYYTFFPPLTNHFVIGFLGIYVLYTIFETSYLIKLGRLRPD